MSTNCCTDAVMHECVLVNGGRDEVDDILEALDTYDWWVVGGRFSGLLDGYDPAKDPANLIDCTHCGGTGKNCACLNGKRVRFDLVPHDGDTQYVRDVDWDKFGAPFAFVDEDGQLQERTLFDPAYETLIKRLEFDFEFELWLYRIGPDALVTIVDCHS